MSIFIEYTEPGWRGLNMRILKVDEAYLVPISKYGNETYLYVLSDDCYTCPFNELGNISSVPLSSLSIPLNVQHPLKFKLFENYQGRYAFDNETALCYINNDISMQEFGVYNFTVTSNGTCTLVTDKEGVNVNLSLLSVFVLVSLALIFARMIWCAWKTYRSEDKLKTAANTITTENPTQKERIRSLDAFRGIAIVLMIFVNSGGGEYWWIKHAVWNGLNLADIVFPSFLWIMGVCISISVRSQLARGTSKWIMCRRIAWRSLKLFFIGICRSSLDSLQIENAIITGILQRLGVAYFVSGILHTIFSKREYVTPQGRWRRTFFDFILFRWELLTSLVFIAINLGVIFGLNIPGCPRGYLGPGGKHAYTQNYNCSGGASAYIDQKILGENHLNRYIAIDTYDGPGVDPMGVFGCILTVVHVFIGVLCGIQILLFKDFKSRIKRWIACSIILGFVGGMLCGFTKSEGVIPMNWSLWSLSFVFVTTSLAFAIFSIFYYVIDVNRWYNGFPFVEAGMNAIILYAGHIFLKTFPWYWFIGAMNTHFILLVRSTWRTLLWVIIALYLDAKHFYYSL